MAQGQNYGYRGDTYAPRTPEAHRAGKPGPGPRPQDPYYDQTGNCNKLENLHSQNREKMIYYSSKKNILFQNIPKHSRIFLKIQELSRNIGDVLK